MKLKEKWASNFRDSLMEEKLKLGGEDALGKSVINGKIYNKHWPDLAWLSGFEFAMDIVFNPDGKNNAFIEWSNSDQLFEEINKEVKE